MAKGSTLLLFMPMWVRDYLATTRGLSLAQRGALTDLLFYAWDIGPLPNDTQPLMRMLGIDYDEFSKVVEPVLRDNFVMAADGSFICERLEIERRKSLKFRAQAHERAKKGGDKTKEKWAARKSSNSNGKHPPEQPS
jgi:uncharacterized protein YdaU (DUF1376 family)